MTNNEIVFFETLEYNKTKSKNDVFVGIKIKNTGNLGHYINSSIFYNTELKVYFLFDVDVDNINSTSKKEHILISYDNYLSDVVDFEFRNTLYLHINLSRDKLIRDKIFSKDYKLDVEYNIDYGVFIINLIYSPSERKAKLKKINKIYNNK